MSTKIITVTAKTESFKLRVTRTNAPVRIIEGFMRMRPMPIKRMLMVEVDNFPGSIGEWVEVGGRYPSLRAAVATVTGKPVPSFKTAA